MEGKHEDCACNSQGNANDGKTPRHTCRTCPQYRFCIVFVFVTHFCLTHLMVWFLCGDWVVYFVEFEGVLHVRILTLHSTMYQDSNEESRAGCSYPRSYGGYLVQDDDRLNWDIVKGTP